MKGVGIGKFAENSCLLCRLPMGLLNREFTVWGTSTRKEKLDDTPNDFLLYG